MSGGRAGAPVPVRQAAPCVGRGDTSGDRGDVRALALLGARLCRNPDFPASPFPCKHSHAQAPAEIPRTYLKFTFLRLAQLGRLGPGTAKSPQPCALPRLPLARWVLSTPGRWPARRRGRARSRGAVPGWATCKKHRLRGLGFSHLSRFPHRRRSTSVRRTLPALATRGLPAEEPDTQPGMCPRGRADVGSHRARATTKPSFKSC